MVLAALDCKRAVQVAVRMAKLERDPKTGSWKSRKVIPADVRAAYGKANETPTWPASLSPAQAKAAWSAWLSEVEAKIERLRRIATAKPVSLNHKQVHALAAKWYAQQVAAYGDDPGDPNGWEAAKDKLQFEDEEAAYEARWHGDDFDGALKRIPSVEREMRELLEREGLVLDDLSREALLDRMHDLYGPLCDLMIRRAHGDYGPDPVAERLPTWEPQRAPQNPAGDVVSIMSLFDRYVAERKPAPATQKAFKRQIKKLIDFLGHEDARRVTPENIVAWKDKLLSEEVEPGKLRSARTVKDTYLAAAKTVFAYGHENRLIAANPVDGVKVRAPKRKRLRDPGLSDEEAQIILRGSLSAVPEGLSPERALAFRWVPWLCAYTGARVGEMTQLRKQDVYKSEEVWVIRITPEAGDVKDGEFRELPLHSHLIEQGFLDAVRKADNGPLFYDPKRHRGGTEGNPQHKKATEALARWVRKLGVDDPRVQPNHGWRHRFETEMRRAEVDFEARHVFTGRAFKTESGNYGRWDPASLKRELEKVRRIVLKKEAEGRAA